MQVESGDNMAVSEKQREYAKKWDKDNMRTISTRVRKEEAEDFKAWCKIQGISSTAAIKRFVMAEIDKYLAYMEEHREDNE